MNIIILVWHIAPKTTSNGPIIVELATFIAAIIFNDGQKTILKALELLGIRIGVTLEQYCREQDEKRIAPAERRARSLLARRQSGSNKFYDIEDGETSQEDPYYGPGIDKIWLIKKFQFYA